MMHWVFTAMLLLSVFTACSKKVFNPYQESFGCPDGFKGDCSSVQSAYDKSVAASETFSPLVTIGKEIDPSDHQRGDGIKQIVGESQTPEISPAKTYRVFIPGYIDRNNFYGERHIYFIDDRPEWVEGSSDKQ